MNTDIKKDYSILLCSTLVIALCGLLYELLIGTASSYLLGNSILQFSLTIGSFMTAFGVGSLCTKYIKRKLLQTFFLIEIVIGVVGSLCVLTLFYFYSDVYHFFMFFFIFVIGILVGFEIPLLGRILEELKKDITLTLANLFFFDYIGAMGASLIFPLFMLPFLGLLKSSLVVGMGNLFVALLVGIRFRRELDSRLLLGLPVLLLLLDLFLLIYSPSIEFFIEQRYYEGNIVYLEQTPYQKIVVTRDRSDIRLYLDGNIQFSSQDEYRYHETMAHLPVAMGGVPPRALILGGGDGLAARELLKYPGLEEITICDLDERMTDLFATQPQLMALNNNSLTDSRVTIVNEDAFTFLANSHQLYNLVLIDLPDPNNETLAKLYSKKFYLLVRKVLASGGVALTQATSPYHARDTFWCIAATIKAAGFPQLLSAQLTVPSFGVWGFHIFAQHPLQPPSELLLSGHELRYLSPEVLPGLFRFPRDMAYRTVEINTVFKPVILSYYQQAWQEY